MKKQLSCKNNINTIPTNLNSYTFNFKQLLNCKLLLFIVFFVFAQYMMVLALHNILYQLVNRINHEQVHSGWFNIPFVIPFIDLNIPNGLKTGWKTFISITYFSIYIAVIIISSVLLFLFDPHIFYKYLCFFLIADILFFCISILFPSYNYLHDQNWQPGNNYDPYNGSPVGNGIWAGFIAFPTFHIVCSTCPTIFYWKIARRNKIALWFAIFMTAFDILIWLITLFSKQHYFLDAPITILILLAFYYATCNLFNEYLFNIFNNIYIKIIENKYKELIGTFVFMAIIFIFFIILTATILTFFSVPTSKDFK